MRREGNKLKVTWLDRVSRSVLPLVTLGADLRERGVGLHVIEDGINASTLEGGPMFEVLSMLAALQGELLVGTPTTGSPPSGPAAGSADAAAESPGPARGAGRAPDGCRC
ncbi:recombinase family protein [Streptomyces virginiae]|uniref:recombinase family protein n=1 Tax=Streptomyces virginiae TaxID=1961 RepID=UPI00342EF8FD